MDEGAASARRIRANDFSSQLDARQLLSPSSVSLFQSLTRYHGQWSRLETSYAANLPSLPKQIHSAMEFELSPEEMMPETAKYTLRALVLQGSDIPVFKFPNAQVRND